MKRLAALLSTTVLAILGLTAVAPAAAGPIWNLDVHHNETNFPPGGTALLWLDVANVGDENTTGPITVTVTLPPGLTRDSVIPPEAAGRPDYTYGHGVFPNIFWACPGPAGASSFTCTTSNTVFRHSASRGMILSVEVDPSLSGDDVMATASVSGGGASNTATAEELIHVSPEPAGFAILPETFVPDFFAADGLTPVRESGAHPELFTVPFDLATIDREGKAGTVNDKKSAGNLRNLSTDLPPGFVGAPTAVGECSQAKFTLNLCPASAQVGRLDVRINFGGPFTLTSGVFNLTHPRGVVTDLGVAVGGVPVHIKASLDPANRYAVTTSVSDINEGTPVLDQKLTIWGVPADPSHDSERCGIFSVFQTGMGSTFEECPTDFEPKPFLTVPSQCGVDHEIRLHHYDSWENRGTFGPDIVYDLPGQTTGCDRPRFEPKVELEPTGKQANTPTGLDVHIQVAQNENPEALATPPMKSATVTLPKGMSFSPSFADGLQSCTPDQIGLFTNDPVKCPSASRIGEVEALTPLLPKAAVGSMYLATQGDNPFHSTFAMYMALEDTEERGALIKIPGRIDVDPVTGQITTAFDDLPQFPVSDFTLKFRSGLRAPLVNPPACGTHEIGVEIASYAQPVDPVDVSSTYEVSEGPNGTACPPDPASRPFAPKMTAGTLNPAAGAYSPLLFRLSREDLEQELSQVTATLPPGLLAKIAGVPFCPDAALASISEAEGAGQAEAISPACPAASQIGTISAGLGAGPGPNYFGGKVYLAGPYKGAPLSLAVVAPGIAGPFDLGNVVVRVAAEVDPESAQVRAVSDPFPTILHGVILRVRDVRLRIDRPQTMINPTSCNPMSVDGQISGVGGDLLSTTDDVFFSAQSPFQLANCANLGFKPKLTFRLFGGTKRGAHPKLLAMVRMPEGGANIASASVALPRSEFLDQSHIGTVCTRVQFRANACPAASVYGQVEAKSPLLDEVLIGPIYLRSSSNPLPDLVAAFRAGRIDVDLAGRIDSVNGGIRNTFTLVPDAPVSWARFTFQGGKKGLLINSRDLCRKTYRATAKFKSHSGKAITLRPEMQNSCKKARKGERAASRP